MKLLANLLSNFELAALVLKRTTALLLALNMIAPPIAFSQMADNREISTESDNTPPRPRPNPQPPTPPPADQPGDIAGAERAGSRDGQSDGSREGQDRGSSDGQRVGREEGRREGYRICYEEEKNKAYDLGYRRGYRNGESDGIRIGNIDGQREGNRRGSIDGELEGRNRADSDAHASATPIGRQRGYEEANRSEAYNLGFAEGTRSGDQKAYQRALSVDYPKGKDDYRRERFAEPISSNDDFAQRSATHNDINPVLNFVEKIQNNTSLQMSAPAPDKRYYNPRPSYQRPDERAAYNRAYDRAYSSGFSDTYSRVYRSAYDTAVRNAKPDGCQEARRQNFNRYQNDGQRDGERKGYDDGYRQAYRESYDIEYRRSRQFAAEDAYRNNYDRFYTQHFETARSAAYSQRYNQLYQDGFDRGETAKFNEMYPIYARQEYARGRSDEAEDFRLRPVRLLEAAVTETIQNGLFEPHEALRVRLKLRNFADSSINPEEVKLELRAITANGVMIVQPDSILARGLKAKSLTQVREAMEFQVSESLVNRSVALMLTARYQGRDVGSMQLQITPKFWIHLAFAENPELLEGLPAVLKMRVTNQSPNTSITPAQIKMLSDSSKIQIVQDSALTAALAPGASVVVPFVAIARTALERDVIPMAFTATINSGRRVGLLDYSSQIPIKNDYRIQITTDNSSLRNSGITRVKYRITNISSRLIFRGLQLKVGVVNSDLQDNFLVLGPNPQLLHPLERGQALEFVVPVMSKGPNRGATLELEVQEDGRETVIHQSRF